jgi:hypothetical protein
MVVHMRTGWLTGAAIDDQAPAFGAAALLSGGRRSTGTPVAAALARSGGPITETRIEGKFYLDALTTDQSPSERLPEVADLVQVRSRRWLVEEVTCCECS